LAVTGRAFVREQLRARLTLVLLIVIPVFFVLIFASVLGEFSKALGGTLQTRSATAISAGWAAAFLSGTLAFFMVSSSRAADRRLALAGLGTTRVALSRIAAALLLGAIVTAVAFLTLWLRSGIGHPLHALVAIFAFAAIYIGIGAVVGAVVSDPLAGSLLVLAVFSVDAFAGPQMTSAASGIGAYMPTYHAANLLIAAGGGHGSPGSGWRGVAAIVLSALTVALVGRTERFDPLGVATSTPAAARDAWRGRCHRRAREPRAQYRRLPRRSQSARKGGLSGGARAHTGAARPRRPGQNRLGCTTAAGLARPSRGGSQRGGSPPVWRTIAASRARSGAGA
jgi:MFS family permease